MADIDDDAARADLNTIVYPRVRSADRSRGPLERYLTGPEENFSIAPSSAKRFKQTRTCPWET